jgi:pimeloyl-ACP methyl ester carboxylesterase
VLLLAHSFGGQVTTALLSGVGKKRTFARVVLTGPAIIRPKNIVRRLIWGAVAKIGKLCLSVIPHAGLKQRARRILYRVADSPDGAGERDTIKHNIYQKIIRQDMTDRLAEIDHPITLLHGTNDRYVPVRHSKKVSELLKHGTLHIIPNGTHGLHRSVPDALRTELISS